MRGVRSETTERARRLRQTDNEAEATLWSELRNRRLNGNKFVRQHPVGRYFADFACREHMLVIELDGSQHVDNAYDRERDEYMSAAGWSVLRFWNVDVLKERDSVLETILAAIGGKLDGKVTSADLRYLAALSKSENPS